MKVKELIAALQTMDPEHTVVIPGYEGGVTELIGLNTVTIALNVHTEWYYGEHDVILHDDGRPYQEHEKAQAVLLGVTNS